MKLELPMRLPSVANLRESWQAAMRRKAKHRGAVHLACSSFSVRRALELLRRELASGAGVVVTLTRCGRGRLDAHDNLRSAFKHVVDQVAEELGLPSDSDPRVEWRYEQRTGVPAIAVDVELVNACETNGRRILSSSAEGAAQVDAGVGSRRCAR